MNVSVSVIISVYNMGNLIEKTIDSVERQNLKNIEVIIIDDGSTDSSYDIFMNASEKYKAFACRKSRIWACQKFRCRFIYRGVCCFFGRR